MAAMEICALTAGLRRVKRVMTPAARSGRNRITAGRFSSIVLQLHRGEVFHLGGLPLAIQGNDKREANGNFSSGDSNDEKDEHLRVESVGEPRHGDEG